MKFTIEKAAAEVALRRIVGIVDKRQVITVLGNVMMTARDGKLTVRAQGMDMEAVEIAACAIDCEGEATVPADKLHDVVRAFPVGAEILMELPSDDPRLLVAVGRQRFRLPTLPIDTFPVLQADQWSESFDIAAADLLTILTKASWAAATNDSRYVMNGTYLHTINSKLRAVACSGFRVAYAETPCDAADFAVIIPDRTASELMRRLADASGDVTVNINATRMGVHIGTGVLSSKIIDGSYVEYQRAIPSGDHSIIRVDADDLAAAIKGALLIADDKDRSVRISLSGGVMSVGARSSTTADGMNEIEAHYEGSDISAMFRGENLTLAMSALNADVLEICHYGDLKPTVWRSADDTSCIAAFAPLKGGVGG